MTPKKTTLSNRAHQVAIDPGPGGSKIAVFTHDHTNKWGLKVSFPGQYLVIHCAHLYDSERDARAAGEALAAAADRAWPDDPRQP